MMDQTALAASVAAVASALGRADQAAAELQAACAACASLTALAAAAAGPLAHVSVAGADADPEAAQADAASTAPRFAAASAFTDLFAVGAERASDAGADLRNLLSERAGRQATSDEIVYDVREEMSEFRACARVAASLGGGCWFGDCAESAQDAIKSAAQVAARSVFSQLSEMAAHAQNWPRDGLAQRLAQDIGWIDETPCALPWASRGRPRVGRESGR